MRPVSPNAGRCAIYLSVDAQRSVSENEYFDAASLFPCVAFKSACEKGAVLTGSGDREF